MDDEFEKKEISEVLKDKFCGFLDSTTLHGVRYIAGGEIHIVRRSVLFYIL